MNKAEMIALWHAQNWESDSSGVYFSSEFLGGELHVSFTDFEEARVLSLGDDFMQYLVGNLAVLDEKAHEVLKVEVSEEDSLQLVLTDVMFEASGCYGAFCLGYDAGDSPAGHLYYLVKFDGQFQADSEVIYEVF